MSLLRLDHIGHPHRQMAQVAIERLIDERHVVRTVTQVLYEYWVVATRPVESNGLGFSVSDAKKKCWPIIKPFFRRSATSAASSIVGKSWLTPIRFTVSLLMMHGLSLQCSVTASLDS